MAKKIRAQPQGAKKNSCTSQRRKKCLKTNNVKTSANYILKCQRTQIRENLHMAVKNKLNLK